MSVSLGLVIPAYNAEKTIAWVFERIPAEAWEIIDTAFIIDDGSEDGTAAVVRDLGATYPKISLYSLASNRGYGNAVQKGLELCRGVGSDYVASLHADGQYPPEKLFDFVQHMHKNQIDILQGSRHKSGTSLQGGMPLYKHVLGKLLVRLENFVFGLSLTDYHSGYLLYSKKALDSIPFDGLSHSFEFDLEVIASARRLGLRIGELGIPTHYGEETSYLNPITYGFRVLYVLAKYLCGHYRLRR